MAEKYSFYPKLTYKYISVCATPFSAWKNNISITIIILLVAVVIGVSSGCSTSLPFNCPIGYITWGHSVQYILLPSFFQHKLFCDIQLFNYFLKNNKKSILTCFNFCHFGPTLYM